MSRTVLLSIAVLVLGLLAYVVVTSGDAAPADDRAFAVRDTDRIARIRIADRNGNTADLRRGGPTGWTVGGKPANENVMKNLLQAIRGMEVQSLPTSQAVPQMVKNLAGGGILVQLFDAGGDKIKGYYIGGGANGELGTLAIMEDSNNPYVVHLPMWSGNLRFRFNLRGDDWRDKRYFAVEPERVDYLEIDYPKQQEQSFRLERSGEGYSVRPLYGTAPARSVPPGRAEGVFARYENYYISRYENLDEPAIAEARGKLPFATIRIKETGSDEQTMQLYPRYGTDNTTLIAYGAFINDGEDWALLAPETTQPLLVSYASF